MSTHRLWWSPYLDNDEAKLRESSATRGKVSTAASKATGAPSYSSDPYPYANIHDYIHQIFDAFGPNRTFWGTDITRMPCPWRQCISLFTEELPWLSESDKELVMGRAVCEWLDWKLPS